MGLLPTIPPGISCIDWEQDDVTQPNSRRCKYVTREFERDLTEDQVKRGVKLPDGRIWRGQCSVQNTKAVNPPGNRILCEEWLKVHPEDLMPSKWLDRIGKTPLIAGQSDPNAPDPAPHAPVALIPRDLFGSILPEDQKRSIARTQKPRPGVFGNSWRPSSSGHPGAAPGGILDVAFAEVEKLGLEAVLSGSGVQVFVVPEHTNQDRLEVTWKEVGILYALLRIFPGSHMVSLTKPDVNNRGESSRKKIFELVITDELVERIARLNPATGLDREHEKKLGIYLDYEGGVKKGE